MTIRDLRSWPLSNAKKKISDLLIDSFHKFVNHWNIERTVYTCILSISIINIKFIELKLDSLFKMYLRNVVAA